MPKFCSSLLLLLLCIDWTTTGSKAFAPSSFCSVTEPLSDRYITRQQHYLPSLSPSQPYTTTKTNSELHAGRIRTTPSKSSTVRQCHQSPQSSTCYLHRSPKYHRWTRIRTTTTRLHATASSSSSQTTPVASSVSLSPLQTALVKAGMLCFIAGMCLALPLTLLPQRLLHQLGILSRVRKERWALSTGQWCARTLMRIFPFCKIEIKGGYYDEDRTSRNDNTWTDPPEPAIWACNHTSMLDVFVLLSADQRLRGPHKRPLKIVYWQDLEANPVTKLLFRQAGFIPVAMAANQPGEANEYDKSSFRALLQQCKQAFVDGFDVALLPEGQLNPTPEQGLLPLFGGAHTLARLSKRPIHLLALHGVHRLWHGDPAIGMTVTGRDVGIRSYHRKVYASADEFVKTFEALVGPFATTGQEDETELAAWMDGSAYRKIESQRQRKKEEAEEKERLRQLALGEEEERRKQEDEESSDHMH